LPVVDVDKVQIALRSPQSCADRLDPAILRPLLIGRPSSGTFADVFIGVGVDLIGVSHSFDDQVVIDFRWARRTQRRFHLQLGKGRKFVVVVVIVVVMVNGVMSGNGRWGWRRRGCRRRRPVIRMVVHVGCIRRLIVIVVVVVMFLSVRL
jgi:hypothetical protein